jgi:hypothetical protein
VASGVSSSRQPTGCSALSAASDSASRSSVGRGFDDVEGRDHVDGVRRKPPGSEGVAEPHVQPACATRGHERRVGVDAPGCQPRGAEQGQPLASAAAQVHDAAEAGEPVDVVQAALQLGADLVGRAAEVLGEVGCKPRRTAGSHRRGCSCPSPAGSAAQPAPTAAGPGFPGAGGPARDGRAQARHLALELHLPHPRRGAAASGARAHPAPTLPASPSSGSAGATAAAADRDGRRQTTTAVVGSVVAGPGSDWSEEPVWGCEPVTLGLEAASRCPPDSSIRGIEGHVGRDGLGLPGSGEGAADV